MDNHAESCTLVIFGAGGDLAKRKLFPTLYHLSEAGLLPDRFAMVGFSSKELNDEEFRKYVKDSLKNEIEKKDFNSKRVDQFVEMIFSFHGDVSSIESLKKFSGYLEKLESERQIEPNCIFYLSTPPSLFEKIPKNLSAAGLTDEGRGWRRVVVEKPFGRDLKSAEHLNTTLKEILSEEQIYRIDHYLGKETVQNILVFRFSNGMFEPVWNRRYIDLVQITVAETLGVEQRASYYEEAGALRDMISSHLLQLVSMIAMEPPTSFSADDVRNENVKVLNAIKPLSEEDVARQALRGQYKGYREEPGVDPNSNTETFAALRLDIDNWRWAGVPFYLRTGKKMAKHLTEIVIQFKCAPFDLFRRTGADGPCANYLVIQIYPNEQITLSFSVKVPGPEIHLKQVQMKFDYADFFGKAARTGYETLLYDCMRGDKTLFRRADQVEQAWRVVMPVLDAWSKANPAEFPNYLPGSWGPIEGENQEWKKIA